MDRDRRIRVEDVMSTPLETVAKSTTVREAAAKMRDDDISALLVRTDPPGIVTSTDILAAVADGEDLSTLEVGSIMTSPVESVPPTLMLEEVAAMMTSLGIKHLPVVDDDYVGMVSSTDVTAHLS